MQRSDCIITTLALAICYWLKPWQTHSSWADWSGSAPNSLVFKDMQAIWHTKPKGFSTFHKYQTQKWRSSFAFSPSMAPFSPCSLWAKYPSITTLKTRIFLKRSLSSQSSHIIISINMVIVKWMTAVYGLDGEIFACGMPVVLFDHYL